MMELRHARFHPLRAPSGLCDGPSQSGVVLQNEYLVAENHILRAQHPTRLRLSNPERSTLAEIGKRLGRKALREVARTATGHHPGMVPAAHCPQVGWFPTSRLSWPTAGRTRRFPARAFNRPIRAHFAVMSPPSGPWSSVPFCTSGLRTSRAFWSYSGHASKVLTSLVVVECSKVRQLERKEEIRPLSSDFED